MQFFIIHWGTACVRWNHVNLFIVAVNSVKYSLFCSCKHEVVWWL